MTQTNSSSIADTMDKHVLYQKSVQDPETEIEFLESKYRELKGRPAISLREDFCGTAFLATEWCKSNPKRKAIGVDLCEDTLAWGKENNIKPAGEDVAERINLYAHDVTDFYKENELADIIVAFNFSYNILKTREKLIEYFKNARRGLTDDGILVLDIFGGTESYDTAKEDREVDDEDFTYIWEQAKFNPITHDMTCYIHFEFEDGSKIEKAFTYEWRLRTIPEIIESLKEAGFSEVRCYWEEYQESEDEDDEYLEETGNYYEAREVENQESWIAYIVAEK